MKHLDIQELACLVFNTLKNSGIDAVLVGGACVSIYTENSYQSYDLDFVSYENLKAIEKALLKLNFKRKGRCFSKEGCPYLIDFVNPPIAIGREPISNFETIKTPTGSLQLLTPTDCVKDRLASFFYWDDSQALEQALLVARNYLVDFDNIKDWAKSENHLDKMKIFLKKLKNDQKINNDYH